MSTIMIASSLPSVNKSSLLVVTYVYLFRRILATRSAIERLQSTYSPYHQRLSNKLLLNF